MLWIEFLNSDFHDQLGRGGDHDRLADPTWLRSFLERHELPIVTAAEAHFGLGNATSVDITVFWPDGGQSQINGVAADQYLVIDR